MSSDILQRFMKDLIKSAKETEGFVKGSRMQVEIGATTKFANHAGLGAALGSLVPLPGAGMAGAAIGADEGRGWPAAGGALLGGLGGALGGAALGHGIGGGSPELMKALAYLGNIGGSAAGAHHFGKDDRNVVQRTVDKLSSAHDAGAVAAAERFGIKEALFPLLGMAGSLLGGTAARAGVGALARRAGGGMVSNMAQKALPHMTGGIGGAATDMVGGMAGGALGNRLQGNPQG